MSTSPSRREPSTPTSTTPVNKLKGDSGSPVSIDVVSRKRRTLDQGRLRTIISSLALGVFFIVFQKLRSSPLPSSYILCSRDGKIYTVDPLRNVSECMLIHGGRILETGTLEEVNLRWNTETLNRDNVQEGKKISVRYAKRGSIVVPGLSDSHGHIMEHGQKLTLNLDGLKSPIGKSMFLEAYIESRPTILNNTDAWIHGGGWDHTSWPGSKWPTSAQLEADPIVHGRPVVLLSKDGHAYWCSEKAMASAGSFPETVQGGVIIRDSHDRPTGRILLDKAMNLIHPPPWSYNHMMEYFTATVQDALSHGLTSLHDAGSTPLAAEFFQKFAGENPLPLRIYAMRYFNASLPYLGGSTEKIIGQADDRLTIRSVKIFTDGALRSGGAALYEPYTDNPGTRGFFTTSPDILKEVIPQYLRDGWQVNTHCIGDRANGMFLDLMEETSKEIDVSALRPRVEHAQIMAPNDFARMGRKVIASIQPTHVIDDMSFAEARLGPERIKGTYAFRTLLNNNVSITLGTDFPVADINPLTTFYAAITRLSIDGQSPHGSEGWFPEQCLTREEVLKGMTLDPAYASFTESILGSLTPGKRADYVVLSRDIMTIPPPEILQTKVLATVLDGRVAYGAV
ncbi:amidohydrolase family-domain-containing protein [Hysterangium stoloniferum]|nr:amidohydrolase family-domain-containing protein [Hysterangium stoloniferum]